MSVRIRENTATHDARFTVAEIARASEGLGRRKKKSLIDRSRETSKKIEATSATDAAQIHVAVVAVVSKDVSEDAKKTLNRLNNDAYAAGCLPKTYRLALPRVDKAPARSSILGLRRIGLGTKKRSRDISRQIEQADNLISLAKQEILVLVGKRATGAKRKLEIMDELGDSDDPIQTVMSHVSGRAALKSLLETLSSSTSSKVIQEQLGQSRKVLDFVIKEAWQTRYLTCDDGPDGEKRRREAKTALAEPPTTHDRAAARIALEAWDTFEKQLRRMSRSVEDASQPQDVEEERAIDAANTKKFLKAMNDDDAKREINEDSADSTIDAARSQYFSYLARFLPLLERWQPAQDFLWQLRYERLAFEKKAVALSSEKGDCALDASRKHFDAAKKETLRMRTGIQINGTTDKHGVTRAMKNDDEYMNSDVVHGSGSRVKLDILEPLLRDRISNARDLQFELRAELAAITQYAFDQAAVHAQRLSRGWLARGSRKLEGLRNRRFFEAVVSAAVMIQSTMRICWARDQYEYRYFVRATERAMLIQCAQRRRVAMVEYYQRRRELAHNAFFSAAVVLQSTFRAHRAKVERRTRARALEIIKATARTTWAATVISAMGRRCLAKRAAFRRDVELDLSQRLLKLTHQYLATGDMWSFLAAINRDYRRYETEADDARRREDHDASTFIRKLRKRREDAEEAEKRAHFVSATADLNSTRGQQLHRNAVNANSLLRSPLQGKKRNPPRRSRPMRIKKRLPSNELSEARSDDKKSSGHAKGSEDPSSKTSLACRSDVESFEDNSTGMTGAGDDVSKLTDYSHPAGLSVLNDIPHCLNEPPVRLLRAAALRTFVPSSFPQGTTSAKAFLSYSSLPPSLVKTNHEMDAYAAVASWDAAFAAAGYREIWELCPPSRLEATMTRLQDYVDPSAPRQRSGPLSEGACRHARLSPLPAVALAPKCRALLTELLAISKESGGAILGGRVRTAEHYSNAFGMQGRITTGQAVMAARMRSVRKKNSNASRGTPTREPGINFNQNVAYRRMQRMKMNTACPYSKKEKYHQLIEEAAAAPCPAASEVQGYEMRSCSSIQRRKDVVEGEATCDRGEVEAKRST